MDSLSFHKLIKNFTNLTEAEYSQLANLSVQFPYSQIIRLLQTRAAQDLHHADMAELLNQSAVYSTDRSVLKWVMNSPRVERVEASVVIDSPKSEVQVAQEFQEVLSSPSQSSSLLESNELSGDALREDLYHELEKLQKLKHDFEVSLEEFQKANHRESVAIGKPKQLKETDPLLAEIKLTKKKIRVENPKQKEQNEIIDQFIRTKPILPKIKPAEPAADLSEESSIFSDNIVSETLVDLLLKQGKKDKAIEVLKKLIWKFPQKKAYFAAQIEDLKN